MKTNNLFFSALILLMSLAPLPLTSQEGNNNLSQLVYMLPKVGEENLFTNAVKVHNELYHQTVPFKASLNMVMTGEEAGWYVWVMGPTNFTNLDNRPSGDAHDSHWDKTVAPHIKKYGRTEYWGFNEKLSYVSIPAEDVKYATVFFYQVKRGIGNEPLTEFFERFKNACEKKGVDVREYYSRFGTSNANRSLALAFSHTKLADLDVNNWVNKEYEALYGEGSWQESFKLWREYFPVINRELWKIGAY